LRTAEAAQAVEEWAAEALGFSSSYDYPPDQLLKQLPLVLAAVKRKERKPNPAQFQEHGYQQMTVRVWSTDLVLLVVPDPADVATQQLYDVVDVLENAIYRDPTLGGRVGFTEKDVDASFDPPEVEFDDGTVARQATFTMVVGEQVAA
jgi:hypothetical protein